MFYIYLALLAYFIVPRLSSKFDSAGEMQAIMYVLELPPKLSYKIRVSFDSLYGMWLVFFDYKVKADITFPSANSPLLILIPSFMVIPEAPVFLSLSDPAKSTKWNLAVIKPSSEEDGFLLPYNWLIYQNKIKVRSVLLFICRGHRSCASLS